MRERAAQLIVYIVDGDDAARSALSRLMRSTGAQPREFGDPARFLAEIRNDGKAVVLLDLAMPAQRGMDVLARLREQAITVPVIAVSACDDEATRRRARELGAGLFLHKPVDNQALLDAIQWVVGGVPAR